MRNAILTWLSLLIIGCGGGSGSGSDGGEAGSSSTAAGSCMGGKESGCSTTLCCQDYRGNFTPATARSSCAAIDGIYASDPCPSANRVGSCALYQGTAAEQIVRFYDGYVFLENPPGAASVAAECAALHIGTYLPE